MAMSAMLLMATEHERPEVLRGTWVYLACTHVGTMLLTAMVILLAQRLGGFGWYASNPFPRPALDPLILVLALLGFGFKAGLVPLHFWLPAAHAGSPSHVSAILSAVMLKAGVYGFLRIEGLLPPVPHLGGAVLALGALTALGGVGGALAQRDYKRLLAYSSVENLGIIFMGVGLGLTGRAAHNPWITALGFGGALLHVWNHAAFKSLLFFGAGSVLHATGTRDMERLGGLAARMPRTAMAMFPAVLAVSALPPFNGFVGEWLLYRGLFTAILGGGAWTEGLALTALAGTGALAGLAFAKFFGFVFLGVARSPEAENAHDPGPAMWGPCAALAGLCLALSLGSVLLLPPLDRVLAVLAPGDAPLLAAGLARDLSLFAGLAFLLLALGAAALLWLRGAAPAPAPRPGTWDCGYARPTARMQYSASSFADGWGEFMPGLKQRVRRVKALFPRSIGFHSSFQDPVGDRLAAPATARLVQRLHRYRGLQQGQLAMYLLYILITLVGMLLWLILRERLL
jgi:hydrogenase-4 component B